MLGSDEVNRSHSQKNKDPHDLHGISPLLCDLCPFSPLAERARRASSKTPCPQLVFRSPDVVGQPVPKVEENMDKKDQRGRMKDEHRYLWVSQGTLAATLLACQV